MQAAVLERAVVARDPRFDGLFFVAITTTGIYCRPVCPTRAAESSHRRFFDSAASAEQAGYRPCLRCRPELAPGRALMDAVPRLATVAAHRIGAGALNGRGVAKLAGDLGVSERHLRRALERELGVSPLELAQTHRLLLAKRLLADTDLPVIQVAFASGFESLRRFNSVFRERYRVTPSAVRHAARPRRESRSGPAPPEGGPGSAYQLRLTLAYRPPLAWGTLLSMLGQEAMPGVEVLEGERYLRTVRLEGRCGVVVVEGARARGGERRAGARTHLDVQVSAELVPVVMPLLARLRRLLDLDAEPSVVDACLGQGGLGAQVLARPGLRVPGAMDGFEAALLAVLRDEERRAGWAWGAAQAEAGLRRLVADLGERFDGGSPGLTRLAPTAARIAEAGATRLRAMGLPPRRADAIATLARTVATGALRLEPGCDVGTTLRALRDIDGVGERLATSIVMRGLSWPDAFPASDRGLQRAAGVSDALALQALAERWRPWRAYAALHLRLAPLGRVFQMEAPMSGGSLA